MTTKHDRLYMRKQLHEKGSNNFTKVKKKKTTWMLSSKSSVSWSGQQRWLFESIKREIKIEHWKFQQSSQHFIILYQSYLIWAKSFHWKKKNCLVALLKALLLAICTSVRLFTFSRPELCISFVQCNFLHFPPFLNPIVNNFLFNS